MTVDGLRKKVKDLERQEEDRENHKPWVLFEPSRYGSREEADEALAELQAQHGGPDGCRLVIVLKHPSECNNGYEKRDDPSWKTNKDQG